jgi:biopolymer transport protein ExbB
MFHSQKVDSSSKSPRGPRGRIWLLAAGLLVALPTLGWADDAPRGWHASLNVRQLLDAGGAVGIVLAALSVAMVALVIEHLFSLRSNAINPRKLAEQIHQLMHERQFKIASKLCRDDGSLLGFVLAAGLTEIGSGYALVEKAMEDACAQYAARLYRKIDSLSVIGTLAPMLGLLGTVWGMMIAFSEFASKANVQVTELAPGISTALVTTLMGLAVAIPAYAAFAYFRNRVDEGVSTCSQMADHLFLEYRRAQAARRRKARAAGDYRRPTFPSVAIEREKSA